VSKSALQLIHIGNCLAFAIKETTYNSCFKIEDIQFNFPTAHGVCATFVESLASKTLWIKNRAWADFAWNYL